MLTNYVLLLLLAIAVVAIAVLWTRLRSAERAGSRPDTVMAEPAAGVRVDTLAEFGDPASRAADFDPTGTMIYRSSQSSASPIARKRDDTAPATPSIAGRLVCMSGSHKGTSFAVIAAGMTIGRSPHCDIVLADSRVSSRHAWIGEVDGRTVLRDLKSTNGTFLNAQIRTSITEVSLHPGDTIAFGGHQGDQFRFVTD
jgi:hypothetical protein